MKKKLSIVLAVMLMTTLLLTDVIPVSGDTNPLDMSYYCLTEKCCCGPSSGVSIGRYYREEKGYSNLPADCDVYNDCYEPMYDALYEYMDTDIFGSTSDSNYGPGFVEMALHYGYDNFSYVNDFDVQPGDYGNIKAAIDNGWPVALMAYYFEDDLGGNDEWPVNFHWVAIKGYRSYGSYPHVIICTDSATGDDELLLNWDNLGTHLRTCIIKDVDDTPDGPAVEDFEWGTDEASLEDWQASGGEVDWETSADGASVVEIDTEVTHEDSQGSARFYRDGSNNVYAYYSLLEPSYIGFYLRKNDTAIADFRNGNGSKCIWVKVNDEEEVQYANSGGYLQTLDYDEFPVDDWVHIEFRNINWAGTYDIYINGSREAQGATMVSGSYYQENLYFGSYWDGSGAFWIDDIRDLIPEPAAATVELFPETDSNPVGTYHMLTATVKDQFGYEMAGVDVTWSIDGVGSFWFTPGGVTNSQGQAYAWITSGLPGISTVRCEVSGNPSVYDTATYDWTYTPAATTVELLPETGENPVDTSHDLTATVYDQFGYEMACVDVTWGINGVGSFSGTPEGVTDAAGQADAVITSSLPGTSTVTCEVTGKPSVSDTATKDWTYTPEAATVELLPETGENPVDTTHSLTATIYDQFGYVMEDVAVTWSISGVGSFSGTLESQTDANGQVDAVITSSFPGTSTVRCEVTGDPSICDTATKDWTYTPEATTLELLPETGENPVDTTHNLTATVYDQFGYVMEGLAVIWTIESGPGSFVSQDTTTDADGQADAVITSSELGTSTVGCEVTGNPSVYDTATKDWTYLEDFEWGNDGDSLGMDGGNIDWTVEASGTSVAEIDIAQAHTGTRSGRFYYDGSSSNILAYYSQDSPAWKGFYLRKDKNAVPYTITGDGTNTLFVGVKRNGWLQYYDGSWHNICKISDNTWHFIEFRNIDWVAATYDIYVDNNLENSDTPMSASTSYNGLTAYYSGDYEGEFWIDDILK